MVLRSVGWLAGLVRLSFKVCVFSLSFFRSASLFFIFQSDGGGDGDVIALSACLLVAASALRDTRPIWKLEIL